jgi:XTP/dITP diphosphohydrolase
VLAPVKLYLASSNPGKLAEFRALTEGTMSPLTSRSVAIALELLPNFKSLPEFQENAPTFAENATGKALYYSQLNDHYVFADDSGLVVPALGGQPGVLSARYAGPTATSEQWITKLLGELRGKTGPDRRAHFVCVIALAKQRRPVAVVSGRVDGEILASARGNGGFGYDPVFYFPPLCKTFAELSKDEKNQHSHRGNAFRKLLACVWNR